MNIDRSIHYTIQFDVTDGKMADFKLLADRAIELVEADEPGVVSYRWDRDGSSVRLYEHFADEDAMMAHLGGAAATEIFPKLMEIAPVSRFDIHGDLSDEARRAVGAFGGTVYGSWKGFNREAQVAALR